MSTEPSKDHPAPTEQRQRRKPAAFDPTPLPLQRGYGREASNNSSGSKHDVCDLSQGNPGTQLKDFVPDWPTANRGKAVAEFEAGVEPLHRLLLGRAGKSGERWGALGAFNGYGDVPAHMDRTKNKIETWKKAQFAGVCKCLGLVISHTTPQSLAEFLAKPAPISGAAKKKAACAASGGTANATATRKRPQQATTEEKKRNNINKGEDDEDADEPNKKSHKTNEASAPIDQRSKSATTGGCRGLHVHDDTIRVETFRRFLQLSAGERASLSLKNFKQAIAKALKLRDEELKERGHLIKDAVMFIVGANDSSSFDSNSICEGHTQDKGAEAPKPYHKALHEQREEEEEQQGEKEEAKEEEKEQQQQQVQDDEEEATAQPATTIDAVAFAAATTEEEKDEEEEGVPSNASPPSSQHACTALLSNPNATNMPLDD